MSKIFPKASLNSLLQFFPDETNNDEKIMYNKIDKQSLIYYSNNIRNGTFFLGGQIEMRPDEEITLDKIKEVREIDKKKEIEYGKPCNSLEAMSIYIHRNLLNQMEEIVKCYLTIMYLRELKNIKLNDDTDSHIISYCL
jgi:hypothetical protein